VYVVGYDPKIAVPTSLTVVGAASLMGAVGHWRAGRVDRTVGIPLGCVMVASAFAGAHVATYLSGEVQMAALAIVMLAAATMMLKPKRVRDPAKTAESLPEPSNRARGWFRQTARLAPVGIGVGLLTGAIGVGGGFLIVPTLVLWAGIEMPAAIGTSLVLITLNCAAGLVGYIGRVAIPWSDTLLFTVITIAGALVGSAIVSGVPPRRLRQTFAVFLLCIGSFVLFRNRSVFLRQHAPRFVSPTAPSQPVAPLPAPAAPR
jgi:uncharacterized membrane protein YfcA